MKAQEQLENQLVILNKIPVEVEMTPDQVALFKIGDITDDEDISDIVKLTLITDVIDKWLMD